MPLSNLNEILQNDWAKNPNVAVQIGNAIENASWRESLFESLVGTGQSRAIRTFNAPKSAPFRPRLKAALTGDGVVGNADFTTNLDNIEILSQTIYPKAYGTAVKSEIEKYQDLKNIDFIKEATDSLKDWIREKRDRFLFAALANDISNAVVCDATTGFKDTSKEKSVAAASKKIAKGDVISVKALRQAILMARTGKKYDGTHAFPIKPVKSTSISEGGLSFEHHSYIILLDSYQVHQLRNDPEWVAMQRVGVRGKENNIFKGIAGSIDGCPVLDMGVWSSLQSGMINSTVSNKDFDSNIIPENHQSIVRPSEYAGNQPVSIGYLIGANALVMAGANTTSFYIDKSQDAGRKILCGVDRLMAISKGRFEAHGTGILSQYANTDYAVVGIFSSYE